MNLQEFSALKVGDRIVVLMNHSKGVISSVTNAGVQIQWGVDEPMPGVMAFPYSVQSTAWFHWDKATTETNDEASTDTSTPKGT